MNVPNEIIVLLEGVILAFIGWALKGISSINSQLRIMNGDLRELKTWKEDHVKTDDRYHATTDKNIDKLWEKLDQK